MRSQTRLHYIADRVLRSAYDMFHLPKEETHQKRSKRDSFRIVSFLVVKVESSQSLVGQDAKISKEGGIFKDTVFF